VIEIEKADKQDPEDIEIRTVREKKLVMKIAGL
jgi:hypothetical protein